MRPHGERRGATKYASGESIEAISYPNNTHSTTHSTTHTLAVWQNLRNQVVDGYPFQAFGLNHLCAPERSTHGGNCMGSTTVKCPHHPSAPGPDNEGRLQADGERGGGGGGGLMTRCTNGAAAVIPRQWCRRASNQPHSSSRSRSTIFNLQQRSQQGHGKVRRRHKA